jgi:hypothetical protein
MNAHLGEIKVIKIYCSEKQRTIADKVYLHPGTMLRLRALLRGSIAFGQAPPSLRICAASSTYVASFSTGAPDEVAKVW